MYITKLKKSNDFSKEEETTGTTPNEPSRSTASEINDILDNLNKGVKRHLSPELYESFQKPKISKLVLNSVRSTENTKSLQTSTKAHTSTSKIEGPTSLTKYRKWKKCNIISIF